MSIAEILGRFKGVRQTGDNQWEARCPAHEDQTASLSIGIGNDGRTLLHCHAGCKPESIIEAVGLKMSDLMPSRNGSGQSKAKSKSKIVKIYTYRDESGELLFQVLRYDPKNFRQRRPKICGGWIWNLKGVRRVLYGLLELLAADLKKVVFIVESEKSADRLRSLGLIVVCSPGGAGKWRDEYSGDLKGRCIIVLVDADLPGRKHGQSIAESLSGIAVAVKVIELPRLPEHGDIVDWLDAGGTVEQLREIVQAAPVWVPSTRKAAEGRNIIVGTDESRVINEAIRALATQKNVYERGSALVHIVQGSKPPKGIARPEESPRIIPMKYPRIRELLANAAAWHREGEPIHPPDWIVKGIDARGQWPGIRRLEAVVEVPVLRADGTVLQKPGYDPLTGIFFRPECKYPVIPDKLTRDDAISARDALLEVIEDFPLAGDSHLAAWLAGVLTPLARYAFHGPSPLFLHDANIRGCGKSLLTDATSVITTGREMARMTMPRDDDEFRKRITALALAGEPLILIDNIAGTFGGPALDAALTATTWSDRILGQSVMATALPLYAVWYATGNNVVLAADTSRRVVHVRLESPLETPETRTGFHHDDLLVWVQQERPRLSVAALTVLAAYHAAGRPDMKLAPWGSFEGWSNLVRSAVVWAGMADPGASRANLANQSDREAVALRQLIEGFSEIDPASAGMTIATVLKELADYPTHYEGLRSALFELAPPRNGILNPRSIGMKLHHLRRRVVGGRFLDRRDSRQGAIWRVYASDKCDTSGTSGTTYLPPARAGAHAHTRTHEQPERAGNSPASPASPSPPDSCPHANVSEEPTRDGFVNRTCRDCGQSLGCRKQAQPTAKGELTNEF